MDATTLTQRYHHNKRSETAVLDGAQETVLLVEKLFTYALGRGPSFGDRQTIDRLSHKLKNNGYKLGDLIVGIVKSEPFQSK